MGICAKFSSNEGYHTVDAWGPVKGVEALVMTLCVSASVVAFRVLEGLINNVMASDSSSSIKICKVALYATGMTLVGIIGAPIEAIVRIALAIITSPLLLLGICRKDQNGSSENEFVELLETLFFLSIGGAEMSVKAVYYAPRLACATLFEKSTEEVEANMNQTFKKSALSCLNG